MTAAWFTYATPPIDFQWRFLPPVESVAALLMGEERRDFLCAFHHAAQLAIREGWDGDFKTPPAVFWLPGDTEFNYGFVWKQANDGTTFVVSPFELEHLAKVNQ